MLRIAHEVASAVAYLHTKGIAHNDIKPENVLITHRGESRLCDFGLSKSEASHVSSVGGGQAIGTYPYMAPEILDPEPKPGFKADGKKCDVYSLGLFFAALLNGEAPYKLDTLALLKRHVCGGGRPTLPANIPYDLKRLIEECWHADCDTRPLANKVCAKIKTITHISTYLHRKDVFLSHDWGKIIVDGKEVNNHERVIRISKGLEDKKLKCWLDENEMHSVLADRMSEGIDNSTVFLVHITQNYVDKVGGTNTKDNCKKEFMYSSREKGGHGMVGVVMEPAMTDKTLWKGPVGLNLSEDELVVDFSDPAMWEDENKFNRKIDELYEKIVDKITELKHTTVHPRPVISKPADEINPQNNLAASDVFKCEIV